MESIPSPLKSESVLSHAPDRSAAEAGAMQACKILIIDDEEPNVRLLERVLTQAGFENFISIIDSSDAAPLFLDFSPDLVLTDWLMPGLDGCAVIEQIRSFLATDDFLPIVVLTADVTPQTRQRALTAGATDFLTKPFDKIEVVLRIKNLLRARLSHVAMLNQNANLEESVRQRTIELEQALAELQQTQRQVIQQERLAALGTMAGGIAHDFNNALGIIMGFTELLLRDAEHGIPRDAATLSLSAILTASEDAARMVHRLRGFYRPDEEEQRVPVDLNQLVEQAISWTQPRWQTAATAAGRSITVTANPGKIPRIAGDAAELREVLTNLIFNAVDAMPHGGEITLATRVEDGDVALSISDTGTGMPEEVRQRCLEPFFTTKGKNGTGLGLSMTFGIIHRHAGSIDIASELGRGTTITLRLPNVAAERSRSPEDLLKTMEPLRVLVVDDQPILSELVCEYLREDFHCAETALSASEALEKFRGGGFDLVITDHVMAGMTGEKLAVTIKEMSPATPVILLTGYGIEGTGEQQYSERIDLVLGKPLSRVSLRNAMAKLMPAA